ncbi:MAG: response receiver sensor histidine kinase response regulator [Gemmatimonadetes bacterium]|nr:response receiver sensor histidine kinase response regulator [Gemmatimonadota bacterium]
MIPPIRILHLEDHPRDADMVRHRLEDEGVACEIVLTNSRTAFEAALEREPFDLVLSDFNVPGYDGIRALHAARATQPDVPVILLSGTIGEEEAVRVLQLGATDYLLKSNLDRLAPAVERAIREAETQRTRAVAERALREREKALQENEERTSFALAAARMGVWEIDLADDSFKWSGSMAPLFGAPPEWTPAGRASFFQLIHSGDRRSAEESLDRTIAGNSDFAAEFRAVWPDGSAHWVQARAKLVRDVEGRPLRLLGVAMDVDERRRLEEQLRQSQKLEAIGQLAGGIAHDFNNVLTVILGCCEMLLTELAEDSATWEDVREIKKAGSRAAGLTRQLLAFSRKQILLPELLDVNVLIGSVEPMLRLLLAANVEITVSLGALEAWIKMDPTQMEQILVNLSVNGVDAMPRGGKLTISTTNVTLGATNPEGGMPLAAGEYVLLRVSDTGEGMTRENSVHIFEPFFTTKEVGKGTGLGLATVYGIVRQSGGDITVQSESGIGTVFDIRLPCVAAAVAGAPVLEPLASRNGRSRCTETILLVEDDDGVRQLTRRTLERLGYTVLDAGNPLSASAVAHDFPGTIDLMLSDVIMPHSEGPPLIARLLARRPAIRALYMSGYADEAIQHVLLLEETPFLAKPFSPDALARKVRDVLDAPRAA